MSGDAEEPGGASASKGCCCFQGMLQLAGYAVASKGYCCLQGMLVLPKDAGASKGCWCFQRMLVLPEDAEFFLEDPDASALGIFYFSMTF